MHKEVEPAIHYWGTPVVVISTLNEDASSNIAPMSSAWWLGWSCMLGLDASSQTTQNLKRQGECVLNLAGEEDVQSVDRLALLTGRADIPLHKKILGYRYESDKFQAAGLTPVSSLSVGPPRVKEFFVQLEAVVKDIRPFAAQDPRMAIPVCAVEVHIVKAHIDERILAHPDSQRIDPDKWRPLIMSFRRFYGLDDQIHTSRLGQGSEEVYAPWRST